MSGGSDITKNHQNAKFHQLAMSVKQREDFILFFVSVLPIARQCAA
jgi:hypothetical protein